MVRLLQDKKYIAWFAGYYDDFIGSQCIVDDKNDPATITDDHTLSHHGNTCNGEAPLNPYYRFCVIERQDATLTNAGSSSLTGSFPVYTWSGDRAITGTLRNDGIHEYITFDTIRLNKGKKWEGKATTRRPQSFFHQNRANTGLTGAGVTTPGYMWVNNPRRTGAKYWYICDNDGSEGRKSLKQYNATTSGDKHADAGSHISASATQGIRRHAYMAGILEWQSMNDDTDHLQHRLGMGTAIQSLGGKPFMVLDTKWWRNGSNTFSSLGTKPLMQYEGTLNAVGTKDRFHIRLTRQAFVGGASYSGSAATHAAKEPQMKLEVGFVESLTTFLPTGAKLTSNNSNASTPAITIQQKYTDLLGFMTRARHQGVSAEYTTLAPEPDDPALDDEHIESYGPNMWVDIDIECDFENQSFQLFKDSSKVGVATAFGSKPGGGNWTPSDFYGWVLSGVPTDYSNGEWGSNTQSWQQLICIDRVSFGRNITDHIGETEGAGVGIPAIATGHVGAAPTLNSFSSSMSSNTTSSMECVIYDDENNLNIYPLITGSANAEYGFILFRNGDYRPIMHGVIDEVTVKQQTTNQTRQIQIRMSSPAKLLDRAIPAWTNGQESFTSDTDKSVGRRYASEGLDDSLYFGAVNLKVRDDNIGFEFDSTSSLSYREQKDQRTCLYSAHPIQMYNNEDPRGPNYPERQWVSIPCRVVASPKGDFDGNGTFELSTNLAVYYITSPNLQTSDKINITGSKSTDATNKAVAAVGINGIGNMVVTSQTPPSHDATTSKAFRWTDGTSVLAAFKLDAASFTEIPHGLGYANVAFITAKTNGLTANIDNYAYKIIHGGYDTDGTTYIIYTDIVWNTTNFGSAANAAQRGDLTLVDGAWKVFFRNAYLDLHTAHDYAASGGTDSVFNSSTPYTYVENRANHSVWMRDLPKSLWFKKMFGKVKEIPLYTSVTHTTAISNTSTSVLTNIQYANSTERDAIYAAATASGVAELVNVDGSTDSFCFSSVSNTGGRILLQGCKFISGNHPIGATIHIRDVSTDYKHIWVLWSDMRNNGSADADGGTRKNNFGLIYPTPDNYELSVSYTDQVDIDGDAIQFVTLNMGVDCDVWECDSEKEPFSGNSWSSLGSDSSGFSQFKNWEDKAGSFLILDFSKFFNLNTEANGGKSGQLSGGRKTLGNLVTETEGHPALIDDYWQEVVASPKTTGTVISDHPNWYHFFSTGSNLAANSGSSPYSNIVVGQTTATLEDTSEFPSNGFGMIELERPATSGSTQERNLIFFIWQGNNTGTNTLSGLSFYDLDESVLTTQDIENKLVADFKLVGQTNLTKGSQWAIRFNSTINSISDGYDKIVFYSGIAAPFSLRFQMAMKGFIESKSSSTHSLSDKIRAISVLASSDTFLSQFTMPTSFGIANMPITHQMTNTQAAVSGSVKLYSGASGATQDWDNYGGVLDARGKTVLSIIKESTKSTRLGANNTSTIFTYCTGRDGMLDIRPAYSSGYAFTTANLRLSNVTGSPTATVTNVRVYYNSGASFVDYPQGTVGTETRWKMIDLPSVKSNKEAQDIARATYEKSKVSPFSIDCEVTQPANDTNQMLFNARHGYILDPAYRTVNALKYAAGTALTWTSWFNGSHTSGMQNALDGNVTSTGAGITNLYQGHVGPYGNQGSDRLFLYSSGDASSWPGTEANATPKFAYGWVGTNSLSEAIQIVHLPKGMPYVSNSAKKQQLRVVIGLADSYTESTTEDEVQFILGILDPKTSYTVNGDGVVITDEYYSKTFLQFKHSGFHEIAIPSTYWTSGNGATGNERIVVSINTEYLRALLRQRNGASYDGTYKFANNTEIPGGFNTTNGGSQLRVGSAFPLGMRTHIAVPTAQNAPIYHAPRISVVDDINFYPSTKITYTDANLGITSPTAFSIRNVKWVVRDQSTDKVSLTLEKDESKALGGLATYLLPEVEKGRNTDTNGDGTPPPPGSRPNGGSGGHSHGVGPQQGPVGGTYNPGTNRPDAMLRNFAGVGVNAGADIITGQTFSSQAIGVNNTTANLMNRITGKMDMHSQFGLQDGDFSILGSKNTGAPPQSTRGLEGISAVWDKKKGAVFSREGAVLPGVSTLEASPTSAVHQHSLSVTVPSDVLGKRVVVEGMTSLGGETNTNAAIKVTLLCVETEQSISVTTYVNNSSSNDITTLIAGELTGAEVPGNTVKVTIERQANSALDSARYSAVVLHDMNIKFVRSALSGRSDSYRFLGLKNGGLRKN